MPTSATRYHTNTKNNFRTELGRSVVQSKYSMFPEETWYQRTEAVTNDVCGTRGGTAHPLMSKSDQKDLHHVMHGFRFIPGGRYLYYAGRGVSFFSNCFVFIGQEDTREEWGRILRSNSDALMSGGGTGTDYSIFRPRGARLTRTGGTASGPLPLAMSVNNHGRNVMQGGCRRSAIYASLNWLHADAPEWLIVKDWANKKIPGTDVTYMEAKQANFDADAPLDFTNISLNYDNAWLQTMISGTEFEDADGLDEHLALDPEAWAALCQHAIMPDTYKKNVHMAMTNGEPGFSFNFLDKERETGRNACCEFTSEDDSDPCNLGSVNMAACEDIDEFEEAVELGSKLLVCGTIRGQLPDKHSRSIREKNRKIGLGIMGVHEWLLQRGYKYEMNDELREWLQVYEDRSEKAANEHCDRFFIGRPVSYRAIAPTGTIGIAAGTTTGIEPIFAVAYKRRFLEADREMGNEKRRYQYYIDVAAQEMMDMYGVEPGSIESAMDLAKDPERRIKFQADVQDYVDMAISSTLNLPAWGTPDNNGLLVEPMARTIAKYAPRLRGLTFYPDGSRGGQPLVPVDYKEATEFGVGITFEENSDEACKSGVCGA